jgi:hypothetical protein
MKMFIEKIEYALAVLVALIAPLGEAMVFVGLLIVIDTFTGMWAAYVKGKEKLEKELDRAVSIREVITAVISSKTLANGLLPKLLLYPLILIAGAGAESLFSEVPFVKGATGMIAAVEWLSIIENANKIFGFNLFAKFKEFMKKRKDEV